MQLRQQTRDAVRLTGLVAGFIALGLLATACGTASPTTAVKPQLRIWRINQDQDVIQDLMSSFAQANPTVAVSYKDKSLDGYELSALKSLSARNGPDIWSIPDDWIGDHVLRIQPLPANYYTDSNGNVTDPVTQVKKLYPQGIVDQIVGTDGKTVYGLPTGVDSLQLYFNQDILDAAYSEFRTAQGDNATDAIINPVHQLLSKPPATWSDLVDQTKYITQRDGVTVTRSAIALGTSNNVPNAADIMQLLVLQNGGKIVSSDHHNALFDIPTTTPAGVAVNPGGNAVDFFTSFARPDRPNYTWNPSMPEALDAFGQGKVAMVIAYSDFGRQLKLKYPKFSFDVTAVPQISVAPLQTPVNLIKFNTEVVTKTAYSASLSFNFLQQYTNRDTANSLAKAYPSFKLTSPFLSTLQGDTSNYLNEQVLTGQSVFKKSRDQFDQAFDQMATDVTQNGLTIDQALASASEKINALLAQDDE